MYVPRKKPIIQIQIRLVALALIFNFFFNMYLNFKGFEKLKSESNALNQEKAEHANLKSIL